MNHNLFRSGLKDGLPIALGYFSVSFTIGILAAEVGLSALQAALLSLTNLTSAGEVAGLGVIAVCGPLLELALTQLVINLRYALMSLSLSQKLAPTVTLVQRCIMSMAVTDEIFAVCAGKEGDIHPRYFYGLALYPIFGWTAGTLLGAAVGNILPGMVQSALGVALYGMFIAVVVPPMRHFKSIRVVVALALASSCAMAWLPGLRQLSSGMSVIVCTILSAAIGALLFPEGDGTAEDAEEEEAAA